MQPGFTLPCILPTIPKYLDLYGGPIQALPANLLHMILLEVFRLTVEAAADGVKSYLHYCQSEHPCAPLRNLRQLRGVCKAWEESYNGLVENYVHFVQSGSKLGSFSLEWLVQRMPVEDTLFAYESLQIDHKKGIFGCWDCHGPRGCQDATQVILKIWRSNRHGQERNVYEQLQTNPMKGITGLYRDGKHENGYEYIVLERLGPCLQQMIDAGVKFNERMVMAVAIQMLRRYGDLHERKIIHNGMKPGNITICPSSTKLDAPERSLLYIIDFETSSNIRSVPRTSEDWCGNRCFVSGLTMYGISQSFRDDLESLGYLCSFLCNSFRLPWWTDGGIRDDAKEIKLTATARSLFGNMDPSFTEFFKDVRRLAWGEKPDYVKMMEVFCLAWRKRGFGGEPGEVDWLAVWEAANKGSGMDTTKDIPSSILSGKEGSNEDVVSMLHDPALMYALQTGVDYYG